MNKLLLPGGFIVMVLAQWWVPTGMIREYEKVLNDGYEIKLKTQPVDPYDLFRGRYVYLSFDEQSVEVDTAINWEIIDEVYLEFATDTKGFAIIRNVYPEAPAGDSFLKAKKSYVSDGILHIDYPFTSYYMEENKAPEAERRFNEASRDSSKATFALVRILDGTAVLEDVQIDGVSLKDLTD